MKPNSKSVNHIAITTQMLAPSDKLGPHEPIQNKTHILFHGNNKIERKRTLLSLHSSQEVVETQDLEGWWQ
ncbi:hypothetical protein L3X38_000133 [Prunus dulcis]|uniref:Uncharacterized protein n=1 Tax=Prunus dulcis TaxID=3755 RepID=A0AAD4YJ63_PRUDU|nr:hypothetical protein L3X38_000133 [Prunus dulcis]